MATSFSSLASFLVLPLGAVSLLFGLLAGLIWLGWDLPNPHADFILLHGPLMVGGFFGTVIALERALAMRARWMFTAPALAGAGGVALVTGAPVAAGAAAIAVASLVYLFISIQLHARHRVLHIAVMALGAGCWCIGNVLWLFGWAVPDVVSWWLGFLLLTIAGERLDLSRLLQPPERMRILFLGVVAVLLAGITLTTLSTTSGWHVLGAGLMGLAAWLLRNDIARRTVRGHGVTRFTAICVLSSYAWLGLAGVVAAGSANPSGAFAYDTILHVFFVGFVFTIVFGHAPIILPAILGHKVPFRRGYYAPLAALQAGLTLRVIGDLLAWERGRLWGGMIDVLAILSFVAAIIIAVRARSPGSGPSGETGQGAFG
jgi:hypothetical protein